MPAPGDLAISDLDTARAVIATLQEQLARSQRLRVLFHLGKLVTSTAQGHVRLRATERVGESTGRLLGCLIDEQLLVFR